MCDSKGVRLAYSSVAGWFFVVVFFFNRPERFENETSRLAHPR